MIHIRYSFHILSAALLLLLSSCQSDFLKEYSQDLSRVQTPTDLNESASWATACRHWDAPT